MIVCTKTFESIYKYNFNYCWDYCKDRAKIDNFLVKTIKILNNKGYITNNCCSGHLDESGSTYIAFEHDINVPLPKGFKLEQTHYGKTINAQNLMRGPFYFKFKDSILANKNIILDFIQFQLKFVHIYIVNRRLYKWAKQLPVRKHQFRYFCKKYNEYGDMGIKLKREK